MSLSVCIITLNEEENLPRCLGSVSGLATQIVVVDSLSTDRTRQVARERGAEVIEHAFEGHVRQKQFALEQATGDWVLCLDADEWLDEELITEVAGVLQRDDPAIDGYEVNRRVSYLGAWIEHGGWSPQWRLRLVRAGRARWAGADPHDRLETDGATARLGGRLNHIPYRDLSEHVRKLGSYTSIMAQARAAAGERASWFKLLTRPPARFLKMYLLRAGFRDGWRGFVLASFGAFYVFLKYARLFATQRGGAGTATEAPDDARR